MHSAYPIAFLLLICAIRPGSAETKAISTKQARELAYLALPQKTKKLPGLTLLADHAPRGCVTFDVLWSNPGAGSVHVMFYCVNLHTAEVWDEDCQVITSEVLRHAQEKLRKRLGLPGREELGADATPACCRIEKGTVGRKK